MTSVARADQDACAGMPAQAATNIPAPLAKWAQVICTPQGQVITGHDDWVWYDPEDHAFVAISSRISNDADPVSTETPTDKSYFTKIETVRTTGADFDKAYQAFHAGFDPRDGKPAGYRLDLTTMNGKSMSMYVFDYLTYGWAIMCKDGECNTHSRFLILNMNKELTPLGPSI
jgi:hypothetical protein